jgi:recombination protein RecR
MIKSIDDLIDKLGQLPSIGPRSAKRLALYLVGSENKELAYGLSLAIKNACEKVKFCKTCNALCDNENATCNICSDKSRDPFTVCVVEYMQDLWNIENTRQFHGRYHVLHGHLEPSSGIGPAELKIDKILKRVENGLREIIIATNPTTEGENTALYIYKMLAHLNVRLTRIAVGIPSGSSIEYSNALTLTEALLGRKRMKDDEGKRELIENY